MILLLAGITIWSAPVPSYWGLFLLSPLQWPSSTIRSFLSLHEASEQGYHSCRHIYGTKLSKNISFPSIDLRWKQALFFFPPAWGRLRLWQLTHQVNKFAHSMSEKQTHVGLFLSEWNQWSQGLKNVTRNPGYESRHSLFLVRNANKNLLISFTGDKSTSRDFVVYYI